MNLPDLDIVLPCYNPITYWDRDIYRSFKKIQSLLPHTKINLIIVNDGSKANLHSAVSTLAQEIPELKWITYSENRGKGYALRKGIEAAQSPIIIFTDIDFPYMEDGLVKIYNKLASENLDVAIGVRSEHYYKNVPKDRTIISKVFKSFVVKALDLPVTDTQCGLKGFNQRGKKVFMSTKIERYLFDVEFIYMANNNNLKIEPVTVMLKDGIKFSNMNLKILSRESLSFGMLVVKHYLPFTNTKIQIVDQEIAKT